jgi:hypothetical protein
LKRNENVNFAVQVGSQTELEEISLALLRPYFPATPGVRLLGVTLSNFGIAESRDRMQLALRLTSKGQSEA